MSQVSEETVSLVRAELYRTGHYEIYDRDLVRNGLEGYWHSREELARYLGRKGLDNFFIIKILKIWEKGNHVREFNEESSSAVTSLVCSGNCIAHCNR